MSRALLVFILCCIIAAQLPGQNRTNFNYDEAVRIASEMARDGNYDQARLLCNRVLADKPEYLDARILIANTFAWNGQYEEARNEYYTVFDYDNANLDALRGLVNIEIFANRPKVAIEVADAALEFYPEDAELLMQKARATSLTGDFTEAKRTLLKLLVLDPTHEDARELYYSLKEGVPVKPAVDSTGFRVVDIVNVDTLFSDAQRYAWEGQYGEARYLLYQILNARPEYYQARVLAAQTFAWGNDFDNARSELNQIRVEDNGYYDGLLTWIDVEKWAKNYDKSLEYCDLASRFYPDDLTFVLRQAEVLELMGNIFEAKTVVYQRLLTDPKNLQLINAYNNLRTASSGQLLDHINLTQSGQDLTLIDADNLILQANDLASEGDFQSARKILRQILEVDPKNVDARLIMGNTYAWDKDFGQARNWFDDLLDDSFDNYDLIMAMANVESWDMKFDDALKRLDYGLEIYPDDLQMSLRKSQILQNKGDVDLSSATIGELLLLDPDNEELRKAYYLQKGPLAINGISGEFSHNRYNVPLVRRWNMYSLKYYKTVDLGTFIGSVNTGYVNTGNTPFMSGGGVQFQIDAYPVFPLSQRYFHFTYAFSPSAVFARHRLGAHIYQELRNKWEISGGFNYANYKNPTPLNVLMFDAGITKYIGSNMFTFGAQFSPNNITGTTKIATGYSALWRHYLKSVNDWVQVSVGTGVSPDNPLWYVNDPNWNPGQMLNAYSIVGAVRKLLSDKWVGRVYLGYIYEEYLQNKFRNVYTFNIGLIYLFD